MITLKLENIEKIYPDGTIAIRKLSKEIIGKHFVAIVGENGSGKSSFLRMIAGLEDVSAGEIFLNDTPITHLPPKNRNIAMIFPKYALKENKKVYDNLSFGLKLRKIEKIETEKRVKDIANICEIEKYLNEKTKLLPNETKLKVALGRALVRVPNILLLDEPLLYLDEKTKNSIKADILKYFNRFDISFIYCTENLEEVIEMATDIIILKNGKIVYDDTSGNIKKNFDKVSKILYD